MFSQEVRNLEERQGGPEHGGDGSRGNKELHPTAESSVSGLRQPPAGKSNNLAKFNFSMIIPSIY